MLDDATTQTGGEDTSSEEEQVGSQSSSNADEDDTSSESEEKKEKTLEEKKKEELDKRGYNGMIRKEAFRMIDEEDYTIDKVPEALRDDVIALQKKLQAKVSGETKDDQAAIIEGAVSKIKLDEALKNLLPEEQEKALKDYDTFVASGDKTDQAIEKVKKLWDVLSPEEIARQQKIRATRSHKASESEAKKSNEIEPSNAKEKSFVKAMRGAG